jgi:hypothetical protein
VADPLELETVFVRKLKRPVGSGVWSAYVLAEGAYGLWLHSPAGSLYRGEDGRTTGLCEVGQGDRDAGRPVVRLIPPAGWWIATWSGDDAELPITVDICTPAALVGPEWTYTDLELDPYLTDAGSVRTDDWDEFLAACESGSISPAEQVAARKATAEIEHLLRQQVEPFGEIGYGRLDAALVMALQPLTDLSSAQTFICERRTSPSRGRTGDHPGQWPLPGAVRASHRDTPWPAGQTRRRSRRP